MYIKNLCGRALRVWSTFECKMCLCAVWATIETQCWNSMTQNSWWTHYVSVTATIPIYTPSDDPPDLRAHAFSTIYALCEQLLSELLYIKHFHMCCRSLGMFLCIFIRFIDLKILIKLVQFVKSWMYILYTAECIRPRYTDGAYSKQSRVDQPHI